MYIYKKQKTMDNIENKEQVENSFITNTEINEYLIETSKWGKFLAIVGYIGLGILVLIGIFGSFSLSQISGFPGAGIPMGMLGFLYIIFAAIYYFPINYLFKFSVKIKQGLKTNDINSTISGFQNLKSLFKFMGIFTIVVLSIYVLILVIVLPIMFFYFR